MGFLKKIIKPFKKLSSFAGKVVKGAASGGLVGAAAAFVKNAGGRKPKKKVSLSANSGAKPGTSKPGVRFVNNLITT
jgi:hypothetical protein